MFNIDFILGNCSYCKDEVNAGEDHVTEKDQVFHLKCFKLLNDIVEELNFDK
jgi:hypothetical protein